MLNRRSISDFIKDIDTLAMKIHDLEVEMDDGYISLGSTWCNVDNATFDEIRAVTKITPHLRRVIGDMEYYEIDVDGVSFCSSFRNDSYHINRFTNEPEKGKF
jgi:hypothetical protein